MTKSEICNKLDQRNANYTFNCSQEFKYFNESEMFQQQNWQFT